MIDSETIQERINCPKRLGSGFVTFALALLAALLIAMVSAPSAEAQQQQRAVAAQQVTYVDQLYGYEISPGIKYGGVRYGATFVGQAYGELPGYFYGSLNYTPASVGPSVTNQIVGGYWSLKVFDSHGNYQGLVYGRFTGGTVSWDQTGTVAQVAATMSVTGGTGAYRGARGTGLFNGQLDHGPWDRRVGLPTVGGQLTLTF